MKVAVPIAGFHPGTTGEYVHRAFLQLGHETDILNREEFYQNFKDENFDLFFCVDSGETIDFSLLPEKLNKPVTMWFIDYRHNKDRAERSPSDLKNSMELLNRGGAIFQAQKEDVEHLHQQSNKDHISWLPMAADPEIWNSEPTEEKIYDIGFVGNIWDKARAQFLEWMMKSGIKVGFKGHGALWKEDGAKLLRQSKVGFNISTLYGTPVAYDINMRFFETLSCGVPLISNWVPALSHINPPDSVVRFYRSSEEFSRSIKEWLLDEPFLASGPKAREFIMQNHTYAHRINESLKLLAEWKLL